MTPQEVKRKAVELLKQNPGGINYANLAKRIAELDPSLTKGQIAGQIYNLDRTHSDEVYKPSRGLFRLVEYRDENTDSLKTEFVQKPPTQIREQDFYEAFAQYLLNVLEDCTKAIPLGGKKFQDKWGTPDVIGIWQSKQTDILRGETEIGSAEIKIDGSSLITAFGQACAYFLFSHKSYLVVPKSSPEDDLDRIDILCQLFGIGLVLFDSLSIDDPKFSILARPRRQRPDMFYVNKYLKHIAEELFN
jgi:hypothetical protein